MVGGSDATALKKEKGARFRTPLSSTDDTRGDGTGHHHAGQNAIEVAESLRVKFQRIRSLDWF